MGRVARTLRRVSGRGCVNPAAPGRVRVGPGPGEVVGCAARHTPPCLGRNESPGRRQTANLASGSLPTPGTEKYHHGRTCGSGGEPHSHRVLQQAWFLLVTP
ncbi:hypothetical protein HPB47_009779 [Ixodes persulcatus]|uniref:Uncharacterized protein n=1 Tax=Ixodes persulcatus TaxID=34615 RepID=A0AC60P158_IXOPE|nr:hypothetical protein HPB47_009779 [Ixodes persulcatus]